MEQGIHQRQYFNQILLSKMPACRESPLLYTECVTYCATEFIVPQMAPKWPPGASCWQNVVVYRNSQVCRHTQDPRSSQRTTANSRPIVFKQPGQLGCLKKCAFWKEKKNLFESGFIMGFILPQDILQMASRDKVWKAVATVWAESQVVE